MKHLLYLLTITFFASSAQASLTRTGEHNFYFDDRYQQRVEVKFEGKYTHDNTNSRWQPFEGSYVFYIDCNTSPTCDIQTEVERVTLDFKQAAQTNHFYTINIEDDNSVTKKKNTIDRANAMSQSLSNIVNLVSDVSTLYEQVSNSNDNMNFIVQKSKHRKFKNACYVANGQCLDKLEVVIHKDNKGFDAKFEFNYSVTSEKIFNQVVEDYFFDKKSPLRCEVAKACTKEQAGNVPCNSSYTCFYR